MNPVYPPLAAGHPAIGDICPICQEKLCESERTTILSAQAERASTVAGVLVHASCGLAGLITRVGEIERIKDGNGSPFPVLTTDGKQWHFREARLTGD